MNIEIMKITFIVLVAIFGGMACISHPITDRVEDNAHVWQNKLNFAKWSEVELHSDSAEIPMPAIDTGRISPDGKYLIVLFQELPGLLIPYAIDTQKGKILVIASALLDHKSEYISGVFWDNLSNNDIYASTIKRIGNAESISTLYHMRLDGGEFKKIVELSNYTIVGPNTIDGNSVFVRKIPARPRDLFSQTPILDTIGPQFYVQSLRELSSLHPSEWPPLFLFQSPSKRYVYGTESQDRLSIYECKSKQICAVFETKTVPLLTDKNIDYVFGNITWCADSSGVLFNLTGYDRDTETPVTCNSLWYLKTDGKLSHLFDGIKLIGSSDNGKYWFVCVNDRYYWGKNVDM